MRAVQIAEFGGPEVLELVDLPPPEPRDGELLVEVSRSGINFADTHTRENSYVAKFELPLVPGGEVAGTVDGRRVVSMLMGQGGYAELAAAPGATTFDVPDGLSDEAALALLIQGLTAWHLYRTSARIRPGESVVVHAAAGGVGNLAVQLAKPMGAGRVIATASSEEKRRMALELGADAAVDIGADDLHGALLEANDGRKVDVVLEMAGGERVRRLAAGPGAVRAARGLRRREPRAAGGAQRLPDVQVEVGGRLLPGPLHRPARADGGAAGRPLRARRTRRARPAGGHRLSALGRAHAPTRSWRPAGPPASSRWTRRPSRRWRTSTLRLRVRRSRLPALSMARTRIT